LLPAPIGAADGNLLEVAAIYPGIARDGRLLPGTEKQHRRVEARVRNGMVDFTGTDNLALAAVIDRHQGSGRIGRALVEGFGICHGALASTVNHDNHNLLVIGADAEDMACAANAVLAAGGGLALAKDGAALEVIPLPIAGLLSDDPIDDVAHAMDRVERLLSDELGVSEHIPEPIMLMQVFALANIPALGLTDHGLIDVMAGSTRPPVTIVTEGRH
jgi:adenine deaminase